LPPQLTLIENAVGGVDWPGWTSTAFSIDSVPVSPGGTGWHAGSGAVSVVEHRTPLAPEQEIVRLNGLLACGAEKVPVTRLIPAASVEGPDDSTTTPVVAEVTVSVQLAVPARVTVARKE
jgi:hypothetical protein